MKLYAWVLAISIMITHLGYGKLSQVAGIDAMTLFYSAMGNLSALLCAALGVALSYQKNTIWKLAVYAALGYGIAQGLMMNCIFWGPSPAGWDVCDYHVSEWAGQRIPVGAVVDILSLFMASFVFGRGLKNELESQRDR